MSKGRKTECTVIAVLFLAILFLPMLLFNRDATKTSVVENKALAARPELLSETRTVNLSYISEFKNYFEDNIGLKQEAVVLNLVAKYRLFNVLDIPNYFLGNDGHVFYLAGGNYSNYQGTGVYSAEIIDIMASGIRALNDYCQSKEIPFLFMAIPDKDAVYTEFIPDTVKSVSPVRNFDVLTDRLSDEGVGAFYVKDKLIEAKPGGLVYYKSFDPSHWNARGAFVGYTALMEHIQDYFPDINILSETDMTVESFPYEGTIGYLSGISFLNTYLNFNDTMYQYSVANPMAVSEDKLPEAADNYAIETRYYHNDFIRDGKTLLVLGDSFIANFMLDKLAESFSEVYYVRTATIDSAGLDELVNEIQPDCMVFECVERMINSTVIGEFKNLENQISVDERMISGLAVSGVEAKVYIDSAKVMENFIFTDSEAGDLYLSGWTYDPDTQSAASAVYIKLNDAYVRTNKTDRYDLTSDGANMKMLEAGFEAALSVRNGDSIQLIVVGSDGKQAYISRQYTVVTGGPDTYLETLRQIDIEAIVRFDLDDVKDGTIVVRPGENELYLTGWAADPVEESASYAVWVCVDGSFYLAGKVERNDLTANGTYMKMLQAGFSVTIPVADGSKIEFYVVNADGTSLFRPVTYTVISKEE
jgi:hypothetical protein